MPDQDTPTPDTPSPDTPTPDTPSPDTPSPDGPSPGNSTNSAGWDALEVLKVRAAEARARRDAGIADLREVMSDDEVLDEFGIDLSRLEP